MALLKEGQIIRDTYEVERFLGEGAFAEVYRVKHRFLGRQAMKVFKQMGMQLSEIEEMLGEAIMLSKIGHPNIVRVFDANTFEADQRILGYFTMENVPGGSLDKFWHSFGGELVPVETTIDLMKQVCRGLALAHREDPPLIHRDIKPQNILVGYDVDGLRARISDFGLAKRVNSLTLLATAAGTLAFKPPEAFTDDKGDSCSADIWAIGTTLYLLLTDQLPYEIPPDIGWGKKGLFKEDMRPASEINLDVNRPLDKIIAKTLHKNASQRYQSADELLQALDGWKPGHKTTSSSKRGSPTQVSKAALWPEQSSPDQAKAHNLADVALDLKREGKLSDAADLMEEAFNKWPTLRDKYAGQVKLWRRGISM